MKLSKIIFLVGLISVSFIHVVQSLPPMSPAFSYPTELYPPQDLSDKIKIVFTNEFIDKVADIDGTPDLKKTLDDAGFKILQYELDSPKSIVVVEHLAVPGYVLKFSRTYDVQISLPDKNKSIKKWSDLRLRVENARTLQDLIVQMHINSIKIPLKYLMYIQQFPIVVAEKITIVDAQPLSTMNLQQIQDLLLVVKESNGILDIRPRNIMFDGTTIYFIDTERIEQTSKSKLKAVLKSPTKQFKAVINPEYISYVDTWFDSLDK